MSTLSDVYHFTIGGVFTIRNLVHNTGLVFCVVQYQNKLRCKGYIVSITIKMIAPRFSTLHMPSDSRAQFSLLQYQCRCFVPFSKTRITRNRLVGRIQNKNMNRQITCIQLQLYLGHRLANILMFVSRVRTDLLKILRIGSNGDLEKS